MSCCYVFCVCFQGLEGWKLGIFLSSVNVLLLLIFPRDFDVQLHNTVEPVNVDTFGWSVCIIIEVSTSLGVFFVDKSRVNHWFILGPARWLIDKAFQWVHCSDHLYQNVTLLLQLRACCVIYTLVESSCLLSDQAIHSSDFKTKLSLLKIILGNFQALIKETSLLRTATNQCL